MQEARTLLNEAYTESIGIYRLAASHGSDNLIKKQLKRLMSLIRKAQFNLSTAIDVDACSIAFKDLPTSTLEGSIDQTALYPKHFEDATAKDLSNYGIQTYVTTYLKPWDIVLTCDCKDEIEHYHMCKQCDWDRYLNNKRRFRPGTHILE